jgi:hypothetical protein
VPQDLVFARGEAFDGVAMLALLRALVSREAKQFDDLVEVERRLAGSEPPDGVDDLVEVGGLVEGCRGAALDRVGGLGAVKAGAQDERVSARVGVPQVLDEVGAVAVG